MDPSALDQSPIISPDSPHSASDDEAAGKRNPSQWIHSNPNTPKVHLRQSIAMDPSALDQSPIISPGSSHSATDAEAAGKRNPIWDMEATWLMFERFVFRRDDDDGSFPDVRVAPIRAKSITSLGDPFTVVIIPAEPPAVSRLYVQWPGGAGSGTELLTTDMGILLLRLTSDVKLNEGETDKYPYRQDYFICQSITTPPFISLKRLPECTEPIVLRAGDKDITTDRRFHADTIGLCRLGDEFVVVQLAKFFVRAEGEMGAELCVLRSTLWNDDDGSDVVAKGKWEVLALPIRHHQEEFNDIRCWSIDAAITFGDSIVWVDYHQGGMLSYRLRPEPGEANIISYNRLPIDNRPRDSLPSRYSLEKYRSLCVTGGTRDLNTNEDRALCLKFVDVVRKDGAFFGPIAPGFSFTITCHTFTPTDDQMWRKDAVLTSRKLQYVNSRDSFMPSNAVTTFPVLNMDHPYLVHFLVSEQRDRIGKLSVAAIDILSGEIDSANPYIKGAEDLDGEYADMVRHRCRLPRSFLPSQFSYYHLSSHTWPDLMHRKLRIRGVLEGGSGNKPKVGGQNKCKKCHELGHREAGCLYNGAKKRNSRRNEAPWEDGSTSTAVETSSPTTMSPISPVKTPRNVSPCSPRAMKRSHTTMSLGPVTRSQTAVSPGPVTRSQAAMSPANTPVKSTAKSMKIPPKKLTPKRRKLNL